MTDVVMTASIPNGQYNFHGHETDDNVMTGSSVTLATPKQKKDVRQEAKPE